MSRPTHTPRLYNSNYTWRRVQIMKLFIIMPTSCKAIGGISRVSDKPFQKCYWGSIWLTSSTLNLSPSVLSLVNKLQRTATGNFAHYITDYIISLSLHISKLSEFLKEFSMFFFTSSHSKPSYCHNASDLFAVYTL
jgi:hypothetical protein